MNADPPKAAPLETTMLGALQPHFPDARVMNLQLLAGGASKETWALTLENASGVQEIIVRRAGGVVMDVDARLFIRRDVNRLGVAP